MAPIRECLRLAAIMKMKSRKQLEKAINNNNGHWNNDGNDGTAASNIDQENEIARNVLLDRFRNLRPVSMNDFEEAISFWIGDGQEQMCLKSTDTPAGTHHYDSDSTASMEGINT